MADVKNIITDGIGASPGNIRYFILSGLDINLVTTVPIDLTLRPRSSALTLESRSADLTLHARSSDLTLEPR